MPVNMKPINTIVADLGVQNGGRVHSFFTNTVYKHMDKYTPFRSGNLAYDSVDVGVDYIHYQADYAKKQYMGGDWENVKSAGHEFAGPYWDKRMLSAERDDVLRETSQFIKRGAK